MDDVSHKHRHKSRETLSTISPVDAGRETGHIPCVYNRRDGANVGNDDKQESTSLTGVCTVFSVGLLVVFNPSN